MSLKMNVDSFIFKEKMKYNGGLMKAAPCHCLAESTVHHFAGGMYICVAAWCFVYESLSL